MASFSKRIIERLINEGYELSIKPQNCGDCVHAGLCGHTHKKNVIVSKDSEAVGRHVSCTLAGAMRGIGAGLAKIEAAGNE